VTKKTMLYMMSVLSYYRSEWTEVSDEDKGYRLLVTDDLHLLIKTCMKRGLNVPNAAKEVEIFLDLQDARAEVGSSCAYLQKERQIEFKFNSPSEEPRADPDTEKPDGESHEGGRS